MPNINITEFGVQVLSSPPIDATFIYYWDGTRWVRSRLKIWRGAYNPDGSEQWEDVETQLYYDNTWHVV